MSGTESQKASARVLRRPAEKGAAAVEFAFVALLFFLLIFGILELARIMYMYNTLADVTRTAAKSAANISWSNTAALDLARQRAIFREDAGGLPFGWPVTDQNIRIDYLYLDRSGGTIAMKPVASLPSCPGRNHLNCLTNPYTSATTPSGGTCVRLVRVRICKSASGACEPVDYQMLMPLVDLGVKLPLSTTIVKAESLGYHPGDSMCLE
jgi:Flp pilus assembly protein TadG